MITVNEGSVRLKSLSFAGLESYIVSLGEPKFRAKQVYEWMFRGVRSVDEMNNVPKSLREKLKEGADIEAAETVKVQVSKKDGTRKYLFRLGDGQCIESVLMRYSYGNTVCISSQAGCRMGCSFCASCLGGLGRNLTAGEIADQVLAVSADIGQKVDNIVVMGVGEPFDNYENLTAFIDNITDSRGFGLSRRSITVSTCGLVPQIRQFAEDYPQVTLAISLHAPNDDLRSELMPVNRKYGFDELISACRDYIKLTNKRITFEYILLKGVNDSTAQAEELGNRLKGLLCHVNLIPFNGVDERSYAPTDRKRAEAFRGELKAKGIEATIRRELGDDIDGACGQLRRKAE